MKKLPVMLTGVLALLACVALIYFEPPFLAAVSRQTFDIYLRTAAQAPQSGSVVLLDIDDLSLATYGQWPWSRRLLRRLTERLWEEGAAVVVYDIVFPEEDRTSPLVALQTWRREFGENISIDGLPDAAWNHDADFAAALAKGKSILGCFMEVVQEPLTEVDPNLDTLYRGRYFESGTPQPYMLLQARGVVHSIPELQRASQSTAFFNTTGDKDGIIRRTPMLCALGPMRIYPALSLEAVRLFKNVDKARITYDDKVFGGVQDIRLKDTTIPVDKNGSLVLNFRAASFPRVSAHTVLAGTVESGSLSNKIVFIGTSAAGLKDLVATAFRFETPGMEVHATAADNMLAGDMLREPRWMFYANLAGVLIMGFILIVFISEVRAWIGFFAALTSIVASFYGSFWLLKEHQLVVAPAEFALSVLLIYTFITVVKYWLEERDRRKVRRLFGTMVSSDVLRYMEDSEGRSALVGRKVEATVFFSDIANFTTMSELLDPDVLSSLMNRYLTPMANIIMHRTGYVDKFHGDGVMAVWGVPYPMKDHAVQACLASLEQMECLKKLAPELASMFGHEITVRVGISTGVVTAGNMGSERRFQYTVMGDVVNQASRLEDANKIFGSRILIGEATYLRARDYIEVRCMGQIRVKGKVQPVKIYELLARRGELDSGLRDVVNWYEDALGLCRQREWEAAIQKIEKALKIRPDDGPCQFLLNRLRYFKANPPPPEWQNVIQMQLNIEDDREGAPHKE